MTTISRTVRTAMCRTFREKKSGFRRVYGTAFVHRLIFEVA